MSSSLFSFSPRRPSAHTSLTSYLGVQSGDHSFLLVRERSTSAKSGEHFALHGAFDLSDPAVHERIQRTLRALPHSSAPLTLDLRGVCALDEAFLRRLLKTQRELTSCRAVTFLLPESGPVLSLIQRLGLEAQFGIEPVKPLPKQISTAPPLSASARRPQWATNESR